MKKQHLKKYLDNAVRKYNTPDFILKDPISIPHGYTNEKDMEITAFWVSILSWGQRKTIINKSKELFGMMGASPYEFIVNHSEKDRKKFSEFKHRTFQYTDTLYFLDYLQRYYRGHDSLETAFTDHIDASSPHIGPGIEGFHNSFFEIDYAPQRTRKHVATPVRGSTCKRLNMFLRWMVRNSDSNVDFGLWKNINPTQLLIPLDVHVERTARKLNLIKRKQRDWKTVLELSTNLKKLDPIDPIKYDFALFGLSLEQNIH